MSRINAPLAGLRRPISDVATYWIFSSLATIVLVGGAVLSNPYMFAAGLAAMLSLELLMIRRAIEANAG